MMYAYEDLSPEQFETLIVLLCQRLLGTSVKGFAKGPDGGRDAKFVGTAELHPSKAAPWLGTVIIQAKHTNGYNRHFGEVDFYNPRSANTVLGKEIPRIKKLCEAKQIDHYMLFANRRLAGNADKHSHPDRTVINVALLLLARLRAQRLCDYDALLKYARKAVVGGDVLFLPSLNFLFLMGLVDYHAKTDALEYVGPNEAL